MKSGESVSFLITESNQRGSFLLLKTSEITSKITSKTPILSIATLKFAFMLVFNIFNVLLH